MTPEENNDDLKGFLITALVATIVIGFIIFHAYNN